MTSMHDLAGRALDNTARFSGLSERDLGRFLFLDIARLVGREDFELGRVLETVFLREGVDAVEDLVDVVERLVLAQVRHEPALSPAGGRWCFGRIAGGAGSLLFFAQLVFAGHDLCCTLAEDDLEGLDAAPGLEVVDRDADEFQLDVGELGDVAVAGALVVSAAEGHPDFVRDGLRAGFVAPEEVGDDFSFGGFEDAVAHEETAVGGTAVCLAVLG